MLLVIVTQYKTKKYFNLVLQEMSILGNGYVIMKLSSEPTNIEKRIKLNNPNLIQHKHSKSYTEKTTKNRHKCA